MSTYRKVQTMTPVSGSASGSFTLAVTPGSFVIVIGGISAVTDNQSGGGNSYFNAAESPSPVTQIWYAYNVRASGTFTFTVTLIGGPLPAMSQWVAHEWEGFGAVDPFWSSAVTSGGAGSSTVTAPVTPPESTGVAIAATSVATVFGVSSVSSETPPWDTDMNFGAFGAFACSRVFEAPDPVTVTFTYQAGSTYADAIAYFINRQEVAGLASSSVTATGVSTVEIDDGRLLLESGGRLLTEDGKLLALESTTSKGPGTGGNPGKGGGSKGHPKGTGTFGPDLSTIWEALTVIGGN